MMTKGSIAAITPSRSEVEQCDAVQRQTDTWGAFVNPKDEEAFLRLRLEQVGKQTGGNLVITGVVWSLLYGLGSEKAAAELSSAWLFWTLRIGCGAMFVTAGLTLRWRLAWVDAKMVRRFILPAYTIACFALGYFFLLFQDQLVDTNLRPANASTTGHSDTGAGSTLLHFAVFRTHATSYKLAAEMGIVGCLTFVHACHGLVEGQRTAMLGGLTVVFQLAVTVLSRVKLQRQGYTVEAESLAPYMQQTGLCAFAVYLVISKELKSMHRRRHLYADNLRNLALARDKAAAEASQRAHSRFVAMFSHELRTPLTSIIGNLELLGRDRRLIDDGVTVAGTPSKSATQAEAEAGSKHGARALSSSRLLLSLVNNILDLSRLQAGALVLQRRRFSVHEMLRTVEDVVRTAAEAKDITVAFHADDKVPPELCGDPTRIQQIILNLTANACKFTPQRGSIAVHVTVAGITDLGARGGSGGSRSFNVGRRLREDEVALCVRIQDSGIGIPSSELERIWQMFVTLNSMDQAENGGNVPSESGADMGVDSSSGSGCGLAICKQLAELMGGDVAVTSELGRGSTFTVTAVLEYPTAGESSLPLQSQSKAALPGSATAYTRAHSEGLSNQEAPAAAAIGKASALANPARIRRVLLAEDNKFNAEVLMEMLKGTCHVTCTGDGAQAVTAFVAAAGSREPYDLVLMDCNMPHKDGFVATREIRQFERGRGMRVTPIVALTAHGEGDGHVREKCNAAGMSSFISKPVQCDELIERVMYEIGVPKTNVPKTNVPGADAGADEAKVRHDAEIAELIAQELGTGGASNR